MKKQFKQLGQGMTEYIIIVALIAIAAVAVYGFFGDTIRGQVGAMSQELSGNDGTAAQGKSAAAAGNAAGAASDKKTLGSFTGQSN